MSGLNLSCKLYYINNTATQSPFFQDERLLGQGDCRAKCFDGPSALTANRFDERAISRLWEHEFQPEERVQMADMVTIREEDLITSVADALQFIS